MANEVSVQISVEEREALKALTKLVAGVKDFEKESTQAIKKTDSAMSSFRGNLGAIAASGAFKAIASGLSSLVVGSFEASAATEKISTQLEVLTGSADAAAAVLNELKEFSASTPFQLNNIAEASAQLISFGFEANTVRDRIEKIGEVAAGSNSDLKEVALIYGQVAAAGKLTGERLLQLQERAIPIGSALANSLGVAESEVKDLVSSGVVGFREFEEAFNSMSEAGGLFEGAIQKQSETVNGVLSTLDDNFQLLLTSIGDTFKPAVIEGANNLVEVLQQLNGVISDNREELAAVGGFLKDYVVTYASLAASAVSAEKPIDTINSKIEENLEALETLQERKASLEDDKGSLFGIFDDATQQSIDKVNKMLAVNDGQLKSLIQQRNELLAQDQQQGEMESLRGSQEAFEQQMVQQEARAQKEVAVNSKIIEERRKLFADIMMIEQEQGILRAEQELMNQELNAEQRVEQLEKIKQFEIAKADIALNAQLEKNKSIRDSETKALADQRAISQQSLAVQRAQAKAEKAIDDTRVQNRERMVQGFGRAAQIASTVARKGTAEQKALATASATINTYAAATRAYRDYPFPANIAVMAATIASGLNQVSQIQKQSFQTGGVVGGFSGASLGGDNTTANVRTGEMVLNGQQQRQLFSDINNGLANSTSGNEMIQVTSVVELDGREIARSVREQQRQGFSI